MAEDVIGQLSEEQKAKHREDITQDFQNFRRSLETLAYWMYTAHFVEDFENSPEYTAIVDSTARLKQNVLNLKNPYFILTLTVGIGMHVNLFELILIANIHVRRI
jgi:hypothetical protein